MPADRRDSVTDHTLRSHDDAVDLLNDLQRAATEPTQTTPQPQGGANGGEPGRWRWRLGRWSVAVAVGRSPRRAASRASGRAARGPAATAAREGGA